MVYLFAYGTLMSSVSGRLGRSQRARLQSEAYSLGPAAIAGRLYDLGSYPGLVLPQAPGDIVHGEVFELFAPTLSFKWLDAYEGIVPGDHDHNEYVRQVRRATSPAGAACDAWVYVYRGDLARARHIGDGRWSASAA